MKHDQKERLHPLAEQYCDLIHTVTNLDDQEFRMLIKAAKAADSTNCWWATRQVAETILNDNQIRHRAKKMGLVDDP